MAFAGVVVSIGALWLLGHAFRGSCGLRMAEEENVPARVGFDFLAGAALASLLIFAGCLHSVHWGVGLVYAALGLFLLVAARRRALFTFPRQKDRARSAVLPSLILLLLVFAVSACIGSLAGDGSGHWGLKSKIIYLHHRIPAEYFTDLERFGYALMDYPLQWPLLEVWAYVHMGWLNDEIVRLLGTAFAAALALLLYGTLRPHCGATVSFCVPIMVLSTHNFFKYTDSGLAETPLMAFSFAGFYALGGFARERSRPALAMAGLLLGSAAWTKSEGLLHLAIGGLILLAILWRRENRNRWRSLALFVVCALSPAPWFIYKAVHGIPGYIAFGRAPLSEAPMRVGLIAQNLWMCVSPRDLKPWSLAWWVIVGGLVLGGRGLWRESPVARTFLVASAALFLSYEAIHLISPVEPRYQIAASTPRLMLHLISPLLWSIALYVDRRSAETDKA